MAASATSWLALLVEVEAQDVVVARVVASMVHQSVVGAGLAWRPSMWRRLLVTCVL